MGANGPGLGSRFEVALTLEEQLEQANRQIEALEVLAERQDKIIREQTDVILYQKNRAARQEAELAEAGVDPLTGAGNLVGLMRFIAAIRKLKEKPVISLAWLDVDRLKALNLEHGIPRGSQVISQAKVAIQNAIGQAGAVFRFGGDDFIVFFMGMNAKKTMELFPKNPKGWAHLPFEAVLSWEDEKGETVWAETRTITLKGALTDWSEEDLTVPGTLGQPISGTFERLNYGWERTRRAGGDQIVWVSKKRKVMDDLLGEKRKFRVNK